MKTWKTVKRKVNDLTPYPLNPRKITEKQHEDLQISLDTFGLAEIPVINTDGMIVAGHQRILTLQALGHGDDEIDVRVPTKKLTEDEIREYNIRSNKNTGEWDFEILFENFKTDDLLQWGFETWELGVGQEDPDIKKEWKGMPEFEQNEVKSYKTLYVHLLTEEDYKAFQEKIGRTLTEKTVSIWYPEQYFNSCNKGKAYVS